MFTDRVYMDEICTELAVHRSTVVTWDTKRWLPTALGFHRDENGWRYWTREQLEAGREWHNRPGKRRSPRSASAA